MKYSEYDDIIIPERFLKGDIQVKVRASVKPICEKCKVIKRKGSVRVICENPKHKTETGIITTFDKNIAIILGLLCIHLFTARTV